MKYPERLFALLAREIDPRTDKPIREFLNIGVSPGELEESSVPSALNKQVAVYELKEVKRFEDVCEKYEEVEKEMNCREVNDSLESVRIGIATLMKNCPQSTVEAYLSDAVRFQAEKLAKRKKYFPLDKILKGCEAAFTSSE